MNREDRFERGCLPFDMLYQLFTAHENRVNPKGSVEAMKFVTARLKKHVNPDEWVVPLDGNDKDKELSLNQWIVCPEPILVEFDYVPGGKELELER